MRFPLTAGEILWGDRIVNTPYKVSFILFLDCCHGLIMVAAILKESSKIYNSPGLFQWSLMTSSTCFLFSNHACIGFLQ